MTPSSTSSDMGWPCPFRGFHCCPDGEVGNKGFPRLISHLKRLHLPSDKHKDVLREAISTDHGLYMAVEETLKVFNQWLCGKCMDLHAVSRACHHPDGLVRFSKGSDDMSGYIVGISNSSNKELLLFSRCTLKVYRPKNRQKRRSGNRKSMQQSYILKSLAMWGKDDDITTLVKTAVKVLSSSGVAPYCDDTIKALEAKHSCKPPPSMPSITFSKPPLVAEIDSVFSCIKSCPKGTSCGRDGLRAQHILDALCGEGSATATDLLKVITSVVNLWLAGSCLPILVEFVASAPLTPLLKPDNGIRPIAGNNTVFHDDASPGNTFSDTSEDPSEDQLVPIAVSPFSDDPYMKVMQTYYATNELPIPSPPAPIAPPPSLRDFDRLETELEEAHTQIVGLQKKQMRHDDEVVLPRVRISTLEMIIEDIQVRRQSDIRNLLGAIRKLKSNKITMDLLPPGFLDPLYPNMINNQDIEHMIPPTSLRDTETPIGSPMPLSPSSSVRSLSPVRMALKRTSTSASPTMTQAAIRKLVADSVATALEA
nr:reverse transcriptase domain-containing protein [Tanacetum cinerariifolium]GEX01993.1 reverse transcriptase domain-containing protein [Tanacetum cinerariifolium]